MHLQTSLVWTANAFPLRHQVKRLTLGYSVLQKPSDDVCTQRCDGCQVHPSHFHKQDNVLFSEKPWNSQQIKHADPFVNLVTQLASLYPHLNWISVQLLQDLMKPVALKMIPLVLFLKPVRPHLQVVLFHPEVQTQLLQSVFVRGILQSDTKTHCTTPNPISKVLQLVHS